MLAALFIITSGVRSPCDFQWLGNRSVNDKQRVFEAAKLGNTQ
jgi:hypothetical protein